jgi:putative restriction endonuclease
MKDTDLLDQLGSIQQHTREGIRAPHKPLLLLLALGRLERGEERLVAFADIEEPLRRLLAEFGPPRRSYHPEYPFWHLRSDGLWEVERAAELEQGTRGDSVSVTVLRDGIRGGLPEEHHHALRRDARLLTLAVQAILDQHFAPSLHDDLLAAVGLDFQPALARSARDPSFRVEVLRAYEYRCSMCGYDGQLDTTSVGVDAAHVRWHALGGPDSVANGLALCALHHRIFDGGVLTIDLDRRIDVSRRFRGGPGARSVIDLQGTPVALPQSGIDPPAEQHLRWHHREVFRGPGRLAAAAAADNDSSYA